MSVMYTPPLGCEHQRNQLPYALTRCDHYIWEVPYIWISSRIIQKYIFLMSETSQTQNLSHEVSESVAW